MQGVDDIIVFQCQQIQMDRAVGNAQKIGLGDAGLSSEDSGGEIQRAGTQAWAT